MVEGIHIYSHNQPLRKQVYCSQVEVGDRLYEHIHDSVSTSYTEIGRVADVQENTSTRSLTFEDGKRITRSKDKVFSKEVTRDGSTDH